MTEEKITLNLHEHKSRPPKGVMERMAETIGITVEELKEFTLVRLNWSVLAARYDKIAGKKIKACIPKPEEPYLTDGERSELEDILTSIITPKENEGVPGWTG
jgi:hypothetical protein